MPNSSDSGTAHPDHLLKKAKLKWNSSSLFVIHKSGSPQKKKKIHKYYKITTALWASLHHFSSECASSTASSLSRWRRSVVIHHQSIYGHDTGTTTAGTDARCVSSLSPLNKVPSSNVIICLQKSQTSSCPLHICTDHWRSLFRIHYNTHMGVFPITIICVRRRNRGGKLVQSSS